MPGMYYYRAQDKFRERLSMNTIALTFAIIELILTENYAREGTGPRNKKRNLLQSMFIYFIRVSLTFLDLYLKHLNAFEMTYPISKDDGPDRRVLYLRWLRRRIEEDGVNLPDPDAPLSNIPEPTEEDIAAQLSFFQQELEPTPPNPAHQQAVQNAEHQGSPQEEVGVPA